MFSALRMEPADFMASFGFPQASDIGASLLSSQPRFIFQGFAPRNDGNVSAWVLLTTRKKKAPKTFHRHQQGFCKVHSFKNKIAFYEAVPFSFHLSSRFAENNLNFMQQLQGSAASFPSYKQVWCTFSLLSTNRHPPGTWQPGAQCQWSARDWHCPSSQLCLRPHQSGEGTAHWAHFSPPAPTTRGTCAPQMYGYSVQPDLWFNFYWMLNKWLVLL